MWLCSGSCAVAAKTQSPIDTAARALRSILTRGRWSLVISLFHSRLIHAVDEAPPEERETGGYRFDRERGFDGVLARPHFVGQPDPEHRVPRAPRKRRLPVCGPALERPRDTPPTKPGVPADSGKQYVTILQMEKHL